MRGARALQSLEISRELQQVLDFFGIEVKKLEKMTARKIQSHDFSYQCVISSGQAQRNLDIFAPERHCHAARAATTAGQLLRRRCKNLDTRLV